MIIALTRARGAGFAAVVAVSTIAAGDAKAQSIVIRNATVVDVQTGSLQPSQTIVVEGTRIKTVGDAAQITAPKGARTVDGTGTFVIPGLWDMHVHATG